MLWPPLDITSGRGFTFKNMFERIIERMVLYQRNFRIFLGFFITSNQFRALAWFGCDQVGSFTTLIKAHSSAIYDGESKS